MFHIGDAFRAGMSVEDVHALSFVDPWFLDQIEEIIAAREAKWPTGGLASLDAQPHARAQAQGLLRRAPGAADRHRRNRGAHAAPRASACARCTSAWTPAPPSSPPPPPTCIRPTRTSARPTPTDRDKIIVLGGGPNRIGQGIEFDYCCVHAALALREDGYETIMVNCNPETVSTDYDTSDRLYFEPLTLEDVLEIVELEKPKGVIVQYGGQTPLKLARALEANGVPIIGTSPDSIDLAEDRERFQQLVQDLGLAQPPNRTARNPEEALALASQIGYPLVVRPSYVLGGRAMEIVYSDADLHALHPRRGEGVERFAGAARPLPRQRGRSRRRRHRRQGRRRADRRRDGAHRGGRRAFGRLLLLAAAVLADAGRSRTSCASRSSRWPRR